jgi:hypothetical protein
MSPAGVKGLLYPDPALDGLESREVGPDSVAPGPIENAPRCLDVAAFESVDKLVGLFDN